MLKNIAIYIVALVLPALSINILLSGGVLPFPGLCKVTLAEVTDSKRGSNFLTKHDWYCTVIFEDNGKEVQTQMKYSSVDSDDYQHDILGYVPFGRVAIRYRKKLFGGYKAVRNHRLGAIRALGYLASLMALAIIWFLRHIRSIDKQKVSLDI